MHTLVYIFNSTTHCRDLFFTLMCVISISSIINLADQNKKQKRDILKTIVTDYYDVIYTL